MASGEQTNIMESVESNKLTNPPLFMANSFLQLLNDSLYPFPIRWDSKANKWISDKNISFVILVVGAKVIMCVFVILQHVYLSFAGMSTSPLHMSITSALLATGLGSLCVDMAIYLYGSDIAESINWAYRKEREWLHFCRIGRSSFSVTMAMLEVSITMFVTLVAAVCLLIVVYMKMDPLSIFLDHVKLAKELPMPAKAMFRYIILLYYGQYLAQNFRTMTVTLVHIAFTWIGVLSIMAGGHVHKRLIMAYVEGSLIFDKVTRDFVMICSAVILCASYSLILSSVAAGFIGFHQNEQTMILFAFAIASVMSMLVILLFTFGCVLREHSCSLLAAWKRQVGLRSCRVRDGGYMNRRVGSLKCVSLPAGSVGVIDTDIKVNYSDKLLGDIINVLLTLKDAQV